MNRPTPVKPQDTNAWVAEFVARHGRKPRVLHIGNIANNAYINCKLLIDAGVDCDLICYDYYHLMGCPEWEEADIDSAPEDQAHPDWTRVNLRGYRRPAWFVQGPLFDCLDYLLARRRGQRFRAVCHWIILGCANGTRRRLSTVTQRLLRTTLRLSHVRQARENFAAAARDQIERALAVTVRAGYACATRGFAFARRGYRVPEHAVSLPGLRALNPAFRSVDAFMRRRVAACRESAALQAALQCLHTLETRQRRYEASMLDEQQTLDVADICARFDAYFPQRADRLRPDELDPYLQVGPRWSELFDQYDLIQAYATEPILPALTGHRSVAFEHGTLRTFLWGDTPLHRLTSLGYRHAQHVFVTNGDCLEHAERLGVEHFSAMLHPVDVDQHRGSGQALTAEIRKRHAADCLLLCPLRHDWAVKGTDVHLRALPLIKARFPGRVVVLLTEWGADLQASKALVRDLGCEENVLWIAPLGRIRLIAHMRAADVVLDQIALPHFGATAPQALAVGTPVISSYDPRSTEWIVGSPAPILPAFTPEQVADAVLQTMEPDWRTAFAVRARDWVDNHHHHRRVVQDHLKVYATLIEEKEKPACR